MTNILISILISIAILILVVLIYIIIQINNYIKYYREKFKDINNDKKLILENPNIVDSVNGVIDNLITEAANFYNILILSTNESKYINEQEQIRMSNYIIASVKENITDDILDLLKIIYKINDQNDIDRIIELRTKIYMINFIVNYNSLISE